MGRLYKCSPLINTDPITYHYIIIRNDLSLGNFAAQLAHAAGESVSTPLPKNTHVVILAVRGEAALLAVAEKLSLSNILFTLIEEPDAPFNGAATALGIHPGPRTHVRKVLAHLPLLRELHDPRT